MYSDDDSEYKINVTYKDYIKQSHGTIICFLTKYEIVLSGSRPTIYPFQQTLLYHRLRVTYVSEFIYVPSSILYYSIILLFL